jgi:hypothetical protein
LTSEDGMGEGNAIPTENVDYSLKQVNIFAGGRQLPGIYDGRIEGHTQGDQYIEFVFEVPVKFGETDNNYNDLLADDEENQVLYVSFLTRRSRSSQDSRFNAVDKVGTEYRFMLINKFSADAQEVAEDIANIDRVEMEKAFDEALTSLNSGFFDGKTLGYDGVTGILSGSF